MEKVNYFIYLEWSQDSPKLEKLNNKISLRMLQSNEFISFSKDNAAFKFKTAADLVNQADHFTYSRRKELKSLDSFLETFPRKIS